MGRFNIGLKRMALRVSTLMVVLGLLATNSVNVLAAGTITCSKTSGPPGTTMTITGVSGFSNPESVYVTFSGTPATTVVPAFTTNAVSWPAKQFTVPPRPGGTYDIVATGSVSLATSAWPFTVTAGISTNVSSGAPGSSVVVSGSGFAAGEIGVTVTLDDVPVASNIIANTLTGSWTSNITIPASISGGLHSFGAYGPVTPSAGPVNFTVNPVITLNKTSGAPGTQVNVTGAGFGANENGIIVILDNSPISSNISANATGSWTAAVTIPAASAGSHVISAAGQVTPLGAVTGINFVIGASVAINKTSGAPGTAVTVTGAGFGVSETGIAITFDGNPVVSNVAAGTTGSWTANVTIPASPSGAHTIGATGPTTTNAPTVAFNVTPVITLNKTSGAPGTSITVTGAGFGASETGISVTFDSVPATSNISANAAGSWTSTFNIPASSAGLHMFGASGPSTLSSSVVNVNFTVIASIAINKTSGAPGTSITVTGTGFGANETGISVTFDGNPVVSNISANSNGGWTSNTTVPAAASGSHAFGASGTSTTTGTVSFTITPVITINKNSGAPGNSISVTGAGFAANENAISITFDGNAVTSNVSANAAGSWTATFTVPATSAGPHTVAASGPNTQASSVAGVNFVIGASISLGKTSGAPGTSVTVTGAGFGVNETGITVSFDNLAVTSSVSASATGSWTATLVIPAAASGSHTIGASGPATTTAGTAAFTVTPLVTLSKASGAPGSTITVNGVGFGASETGITVSFDNNPIASNILAGVTGSWSANVTIPAATLGTHAIAATSLTTPLGAGVQSNFSIGTSAAIQPTTGSVGSSVRITGSGFAANSAVNITYDDAPLLSATADASGSINQSVVIPVSKAGTHTIAVTDSQGNSIKTTFTISSTALAAPSLTSPRNDASIGMLGGAAPTFAWTAVTSPNGVFYQLQISMVSDFSFLVLERTNIQSTQYILDSSEALPSGQYFWRVRALDKASNESPWSDARRLKSGAMPMWLLVLLIGLGLVLVGALIYALSRPSRQEAITVNEVEPRYAPSQWQSLEYGEGGDMGRERPAPQRLALPEFSRTARTVATEEQSRLKVIMEFAEALPLPEVDYDAKCLVDLVESQLQTQLSPPVYEQLLNGQIHLRYEPTWIRHPIYKDLTAMLQKQPSLQKLSIFISDVEHCATSAMSLLQQIYHDAAGELPPDFLARGGWQYLTAVYTDALSWYGGRSLRDPLERDYVIEPPGLSERGTTKSWLSGDATTPFPGRLILAGDEAEAQRLRALHLKMRRTWRSNEKTRLVAAAISQLRRQRDELTELFKIYGRS